MKEKEIGMPSPFPGMDPYLEHDGRWSDLRQRLIVYISESLRPQLRPKYIAQIDVRIEHRPQGKGEERRIPYLRIVNLPSGDAVTMIEVLGPANKQGSGRNRYFQLQDKLLNLPVNLVEIDLLSRPTTTSARFSELHSPHDWRYNICINRPQKHRGVEVYAIPLRDRLPRCKIPLLPEDDDAVLDLPAILARCYEVGGYDLLLDYSKPPPVPLSKAEEEWMEALLLEKGLRNRPVQQ